MCDSGNEEQGLKELIWCIDILMMSNQIVASVKSWLIGWWILSGWLQTLFLVLLAFYSSWGCWLLIHLWIKHSDAGADTELKVESAVSCGSSLSLSLSCRCSTALPLCHPSSIWLHVAAPCDFSWPGQSHLSEVFILYTTQLKKTGDVLRQREDRKKRGGPQEAFYRYSFFRYSEANYWGGRWGEVII